MPEERNETWVWFALAALAIAYFIMKRGFEFEFEFDPKILRRFAGPLTYLVPTVFAVFFGFWQRRQAAAALERLEGQLLTEGLMKQESRVRTRLRNGIKGGAFTAELRLTRAALYVVDSSGRRGVMRYAFRRATSSDSAVRDAMLEGSAETGKRVAIEIVGPSDHTIEIRPEIPEQWWGSIRAALGRSTATPAPEPEEGVAEEPAAGFPWITS